MLQFHLIGFCSSLERLFARNWPNEHVGQITENRFALSYVGLVAFLFAYHESWARSRLINTHPMNSIAQYTHYPHLQWPFFTSKVHLFFCIIWSLALAGCTSARMDVRFISDFKCGNGHFFPRLFLTFSEENYVHVNSVAQHIHYYYNITYLSLLLLLVVFQY